MISTSAHTASSAARLLAGLIVLVAPLGALAEPRILPVTEGDLTDEQREIVGSAPIGMTNAVTTYLPPPVLTRNLLPFERFISSESSLDPRHRELLALRTAWLARSDYLWAQRADEARRAGLTDEEQKRIAHGPDAPGWDPFEAGLLRAVDELQVDSFVSDETWSKLAARYTNEQLVDLVFTVGEFTMIAGTVNSLGVEIEPERNDRRPYGIPYRIAAEWTNERLIDKGHRVPPLEPDEWTPEIRALLDPSDSGRNVANVYKVYVHSLSMDLPRRRVSEHIRNETTLTDWQREVLLLRIGVLCRSEYEWAVHERIARNVGLGDADLERIIVGPDHPNDDPAELALLRATDELYRDHVVSDETRALLTASVDTPQLLDILTTIGGYRMFSMAINTFGVQLDANMMETRFPPQLR